MRAAIGTVQSEVRALRRDMAGAHRQLRRTEHQVEQLLALRRAEQDTVERLERLAPLMDAQAAARHAREAITQARRVSEPFPHLVVAPLLPPEIYGALLESIPPVVFFARGESGLDEMHVPPDLAPLHAVATWKFFARVVRHAIAPALVEAFGDVLGDGTGKRRTVEGRLIRRTLGAVDAGPASPMPGSDDRGDRHPVLRMVLHLAPVGDMNANTAVAFLEAPGVPAYAPVPAGAPGGDVNHSYELEIGFPGR